MSSPSDSGRLTNEESADLTDRVERFRAAWSPDASADLSPALPPPGARHRSAVLVRVVLIDMERRAAAGLPFRVERYVNQFPDDLATNVLPAELLVAEYRLRHRHTDRPDLSEYERWFPAQFPLIAEAISREPPDTPDTPGQSDPTRILTDRPSLPRSGSVSRNPARAPGARPPGGPNRNTVRAAGPQPDIPYQLVRKLGEGAFGEVYEARTETGIPVAIKFITRSLNHPSSRIEQDALEAIKGLAHPFLLKTIDYTVLSDRLMIVLELADGSLADRIAYHNAQNRPGVPPEELVPVFEQVASALDYLHSENVSHRDIKPENILLLKGYAKVADFGLAHTHKHTLTIVGGTMGTPAYMAPEMWQELVSLHSDQYSLAATYVRARLGRNLFQATVLVDLGMCALTQTPDLDPLPEREQAVLLKALAKNPDDRYPSCVEFAKALRDAVMPPPEPPPPPPPARRLVLLGLVAALCVVVVALALRGKQSDGPQPPIPDPPVVAPPIPEKPLVAFAGWHPDTAEPRVVGQKRYPLRLTRTVADETLVAILIVPNDGDDLTPFYMLKHKLSNRVFRTLWKEIEDDKTTDLHRFGNRRDALAPRKWDPDAPPDAPVLGVTVPEAMLVAKRLGGSLPVFRQWLKATGGMERESGPKPPAGDPPAQGLNDAQLLEWFKGRDLGLGRDRPLPVSEGRGDESCFAIRQLVSNGPEWLGQSDPDNDNMRIVLVPPPNPTSNGVTVGRNYSDTHVMSFDQIKNAAEVFWLTETKKVRAGFRVVLVP